ncbi:asparagine synthase (glutamine-hydrolyzing) [Ornithinibacillus halophilus]|uniref:asparagine synthase (glutamine-hydrolyzing) n=1 Tax=Ornithinibacillus halophilus TaxID=930117 RepID=A0A1M5GBU9_9BACI|nr:asparagine synthase (glutamine-hydrolyzing) [Ornithinibacillus halophilus]SHG01213.1 asparagine synthase (glutamine-hydrolysing) [Ornithinibacillus halophilus]
MFGYVGILPNESSENTLDYGFSENKKRPPMLEGLSVQDETNSAMFQSDLKSNSQIILFDHGRYLLIFNGNILNKESLIKKLKNRGYCFRSKSDTEVIASLFLEQGLDAFLDLRGMFTIVIWDSKTKTTYGVRDPFGIKPIYLLDNEESLVFASEKKKLLTLVNSHTVNKVALQQYFSFQYVPQPRDIVEGIQQLEPGHYFIKPTNKPLRKIRYFNPTFNPVKSNQNLIVNRIQEVLVDSVKQHIMNDVKVGAFLSGGIDSSFITAIAKDFVPDLTTISVGFDIEGYSEIPLAEKTAESIGVDHHSYIVTPEEFVESLPRIIWHLEDPLADPACIPLYFASKEASKYMNVVLSGEGADELFGGYNIYREYLSLRYFNYIPSLLLDFINRLAKIIPEGIKGKSFLERGTTPLENRYIGNAKIFEEQEKQLFLKNYDLQHTYTNITKELFNQIKDYHPSEQMQYIDINTWLSGDILLKANKMTNAHSLELRSPFLDKEVFQVARNISIDCKYHNKTTKYILRKAAEGIVPDHVIHRPKLGFPVPIKHWLRNELYEWAKTLIDESNVDEFINKEYVKSLLAQHINLRADHSRKLWTVLMFMVWHQVFVEDKCLTINEPMHNNDLGRKTILRNR